MLNAYSVWTDGEIREIPKQFRTDEKTVDQEYVLGYLREHTSDVDSAEGISEWREEPVHHGSDGALPRRDRLAGIAMNLFEKIVS